jgi:hypothetical protein
MRHLLLGCTISSFLLLLVAMPGGCSSASTTITCKLTPPAQDDYCTAMADYLGRCGHCHDCTEQNLQNCTQREMAISAAYHAAFVSCKDAIPCTGLPGPDPGGDPSFSPCVEQQMQNATPTAAQAQAKTAYCSACSATNANDCTSFFSSSGPGYNVLLYSDQLAMMAVANCSSKCDPLTYAICVALLFCGNSGGDFCVDGGFCAPH